MSLPLAQYLKALAIEREHYRCAMLLPLVHVTWNSGKVKSGARRLILKVGNQRGWLNRESQDLVTRWLEVPPTEDFINHGLGLLELLKETNRGIGADVKYSTLLMIMEDAIEVAATSCGPFTSKEARAQKTRTVL
tara:strand:- start:213 stop:617 length:405 start_codon:yes stop_codon:yes gene_type:complete